MSKRDQKPNRSAEGKKQAERLPPERKDGNVAAGTDGAENVSGGENTQVGGAGVLGRFLTWCKKHALGVDTLAACAVSGYLTASFFAMLADNDFSTLTFVENLSRGRFWGILLAVFVGLLAMGIATRRRLLPCIGLAASTLLFSAELAVLAKSLWLDLGLLVLAAVVIKYVWKDDRLCLSKVAFSSRTGWILTGVGVVLFTTVIAFSTSIRYSAFLCNTFDFGLFAQMFEGMAQTGVPVTTLERNVELTHFAVHFSPIYYLLLPGYLIFRSPYYLFWAQALGVAAGAFAVYGIARKLDLAPTHATGCAFLYLLYPAMSNGCFYDFHENKFLPVTVLFLVYFLLPRAAGQAERSETTGTGFSSWLRRTGRAWLGFLPALGCALLVLSVKEDAAVYVAAVALWVILTQKKKWRGAVLFLLSVVYLGFAVKMISHFGGQLLVGRYPDFLREGNSFTDVLMECFYGIGRFLHLIVEKNYTENRMQFVLWMLLPVLFAPFFAKKQGTLVLLLPMLLINLMSADIHQFDIGFQYTFGVGALIVVAFVIMLADKKPEKRGRTLVFALVFSFILTASLTFPRIGYYQELYVKNRTYYAEAEQVLADNIPKGASVSANSSMTAHFSRSRDVHSIGTSYWSPSMTEYYVVRTDVTFWCGKDYKGGEQFLEEYYPDRYEKIADGAFFEIYRLKGN